MTDQFEYELLRALAALESIAASLVTIAQRSPDLVPKEPTRDLNKGSEGWRTSH